jgi:hypothetical protein
MEDNLNFSKFIKKEFLPYLEDDMNCEDKVNNPSHYQSGGLEVIDIIETKLSSDQLKGYYLGNILKYVFRHEYKDGITDLKKARWYLDRLITYNEKT